MKMDSIADALVYSVTYINLRCSGDDSSDDEDVGALESIAGMLSAATEDVKDALAEAARRALANELSQTPREEFVRDYATWMENMYGEDEWTGNARRRP